MTEDFAALADLVGQLLAARWIEEFEQDQHDDGTSTRQPFDLTTQPMTGRDNEKSG